MTDDRHDDAVLLRLIRLASPALPVGGFSYSDGLESAVESGRVTDGKSALAWLVDQLHLALGCADLAAVGHGMTAWTNRDANAVAALNSWVVTTRETAESRAQALQMGRSMAQWLRLGHADDARLAILDALRPAPSWPVAFALAGALSGACPRDALLAYAAGWAENMSQAAMRAVPLGQSDGQRLVAGLQPEIVVAVDAALATPFDAMQAFTPMLAILSSQHEAQYSRLFRS